MPVAVAVGEVPGVGEAVAILVVSGRAAGVGVALAAAPHPVAKMTGTSKTKVADRNLSVRPDGSKLRFRTS